MLGCGPRPSPMYYRQIGHLMNKLLLTAALGSYVAVVAWIGVRRADPGLAETLAQTSPFVLPLLNALLYAVIAFATFWVVSGLSQLTYRLADNGETERKTIQRVTQGLTLVALLSRLPCLLTQEFLHSPLGIVALLIPAVWAIAHVVRAPNLGGVRKLAALAPLFAYLLIDTLLLMRTAQG